MKRDDLSLQALDFLRFPLAVGVLILHVFNTESILIGDQPLNTADMPVFTFMEHFIDAFIRELCVPAFFFIAGYLFFLSGHLTRASYFQKLRNRVKTLFIPYIIWNTIAILLLVGRLLPIFSGFLSNTNASWQPDCWGYLSAFWVYNGALSPPVAGSDAESLALASTFPLNFPLWFLRDLMIVVICSPLIYAVIRKCSYYLLIPLAALWWYFNTGTLTHLSYLLTAFLFFGSGATLSLHAHTLSDSLGKYARLSFRLFPLIGLFYIGSAYFYPPLCSVFQKLNIFVGIVFVYNAALWLLRHNVCKVNSLLSASSIFIYLGHALLCGRLTKVLLLSLKPTSDLATLGVFLSSVVMTLAFLLLTFYLMRRYVPSLLGVLIGRN